MYFGILAFLWIPFATDRYGYTNYKTIDMGPFRYFPNFLLGVILADMECMNPRPLDKLRNLNIWLAMLRNCVLFFLFCTFGAYNGENNCKNQKLAFCDYWLYSTINFWIPNEVGWYIGGFSIMVLALTSEGTQWFLNTPPL